MKTLNTLLKLVLNNKKKNKLSKDRIDYIFSALALTALSSQVQSESNDKGYKIDVSVLAKAAGVEVTDINKVEIKLSDSSKGEIIALGEGIFQFFPSEGETSVSFVIGGSGIASSFTSSFSAAAGATLKDDFVNSWNNFIDSLGSDSASNTAMDYSFDYSMTNLAAIFVGAFSLKSEDEDALESITGAISHGTLSNAQVFLDTNSDGILDWTDANNNSQWDSGEGEQWTLSDEDGIFTLSNISAADKASGTLVGQAYKIDGVSQTVDMISGSDVANLMMIADTVATAITPLTSLVKAGASNDDVLDILGLDDLDIDINNFNPYSDTNDGTSDSIAFEKAATKLFTTVNTIAEAVGSAAGSDLSASEGFKIAMLEVAGKIGEEIAVRTANTAIDVEAAALQAEVVALQAIVTAAGDDVTEEQTGAVTVAQGEVTTKEAEKTTEKDLDLTDATTIAEIASTTIVAADTQIKAVKAAEEVVLQAQADVLQAIVTAAGDEVTVEQTDALAAQNVLVSAKNIEANDDKVGDEVTVLVSSVSKAIINVNTQVESITVFDATAKDTLNIGTETLATQVKAAIDSGASISLAADTLVTLSEDDTSLSFTAVAGTATLDAGIYGDIVNDGAGLWTYTLHTAGSHGQAQSEGDSYADEFVITDGNSEEHKVTVMVFGKDDAAVISAADATIAEGVVYVSGSSSHTDVDTDDADDEFLAVTDVASTYGTYTVTTAGDWTYTLDNANTTIDALGDDESTTDTVTVTSGDGTTKDITITITGVNDAPVFTSSATATTPENGTAATIIAASDAESDAITYSISGTDSALFSIGASTGVLTFIAAPDYEGDDPAHGDPHSNDYTLTVTASDGTVTVDQALTVEVSNVEGGPVFSSAETVAKNENQTAVLTLTASDDENDNIVFTISGGDDADSFSLDGAVLTFASSPNYEVKSSYSLIVTASETTTENNVEINTPNTTDQTITVSINDINDDAVITASGDSITEGTATVSGTATHTDADADNADNTFVAVTDVASTYGTYTVTNEGAWTYTLTSSDATIDALGEGQSTTDTITVTAEDGTTKDITITIDGANDAAVIAGTSAGAVTEDSLTTTATGTLTHTDVDSNNAVNIFTEVTTETASNNGYGTYTMTDGGDWTYRLLNTNSVVDALAASATIADSFAVTAEDGTSQTVTVTITGANDAPTVVDDTATVLEDADATVISVLSNDSDSEGTSLVISGRSNGTNGATVADLGDGTVSYKPAANFTGTDSFIYTTSDGVDTTSGTVTVTVTPVNDDPTGSVTITGTAKTGQTLTASNDLADVDGIGSITYQWAKDGNVVSDATGSTLVLDDDDIDSAFTVTASYTDDDGTAESEVSAATSVSDIDKPFMITSEMVSASVAPDGSYALDPDEQLIKLTLNLDMDRISDSSVDSLLLAVIDFSFDWNDVEAIAYSGGPPSVGYQTTEINLQDLDSVTVFNKELSFTHSQSTADQFDTIQLTSLHTTLPQNTTLMLVDNVETSGWGAVDHASSADFAYIYLNPKSTTSSIDFTYSAEFVVNQSDDEFLTQLSYTTTVDII